jgi:serine/threonine protein kinase
VGNWLRVCRNAAPKASVCGYVRSRKQHLRRVRHKINRSKVFVCPSIFFCFFFSLFCYYLLLSFFVIIYIDLFWNFHAVLYETIITALILSCSGQLYPNPGNMNPLATLLSKSPYAQHPSFRPAVSLLYCLISFNPSSRITASQALQHEYPSIFYTFLACTGRVLILLVASLIPMAKYIFGTGNLFRTLPKTKT